MPTSSQALTWLKKLEGYESHHPNPTVSPICPGNRLPDVFLHRRGVVGLPAIHRQLMQPQNPTGYQESNDLAPSTSKFFMLPPISGSTCLYASGLRAHQKKSPNPANGRSEGQLITSDGRDLHAECCQPTGNLGLDKDWNTFRTEGDTTVRQHGPALCPSETSTRTTIYSWSAASLDDQQGRPKNHTSSRGEDGHPVDLLLSYNEDSQPANPCTSRDIDGNSVDSSTSREVDSQQADASLSRYVDIPSANPPSIIDMTRNPTDPSSCCGVSGRPASPISRPGNKERQPVRYPTLPSTRGPRHGPASRQRQPLVTCILNLNLQDMSKMAVNNSSSCMSILSYNHKMGRRTWQLVPHHSSSLNYHQMSGQRLQRFTVGEEKRKGCVREPYQINSGPKNTYPVVPSAAFDDDGEEIVKESEENTSTDIFHAEPPGSPSADFGTSSRVDQDRLETVKSCLSGASGESSSPEADDYRRGGVISPANSSCQPHRMGKKLMSSGVIDNQSYFFQSGDQSPEVGARFLSPIGFGPSPVRYQPGRILYSASSRPCSPLEYIPPPFALLPDGTPAQTWERDKHGNPSLLPRLRPQTRVRKSSETSECSEELVESEQLVSSFSPDGLEHEAGWEQQTAEVDDVELPASAREPVIPPKHAHERMRVELPPSHPGRLCFRTSLSCCSHSEVVQQVECQAPVRVSWLQYEPVSLHCWDQDKEDYQHLCMWIFELTADSNASDLLLRGFQLRGQHMNVVRLDDVYREEHRAHNMCQQVVAEQRSKSLISSKCSKLALSSMRVV